tara:strand:- start:616 stop:792 length:177 start_codon:yes stop_codon:yes gene_type:complete
MINLTKKPEPAVIFSCQIVTLEGVAWVFRSGGPALLLNEFLQSKNNRQVAKCAKGEGI